MYLMSCCGLVQARHNVHMTVLKLGATVLGKIGRLGTKLKQHHAHAREEGIFLVQPYPLPS